MKHIKIKFLLLLFCVFSFAAPFAAAYTKKDLENVQTASNFAMFIGYLFGSPTISLPSSVVEKVMQAALENENTGVEGVLSGVLVAELLSYWFNHHSLTSYTNFLLYFQAQQKTDQDRIVHVLARLLRAFIVRPLLSVIKKHKLYQNQRAFYRLVRATAHFLPSMLIGLGETLMYQQNHQMRTTWPDFGKLALADIGQHLGAEFLGELVLQGAEDGV